MDFEELMNDPKIAELVEAMARGRGRRELGNMGPSNPLSNLADAYPKLKAQSDQMKIQEAERKVKKMKFDAILKQAEQQYKLKEQQKQIQEQQRQMDAARRSV